MIKAVLFDGDKVVVNKKENFSVIFSREYGLPYEELLPFWLNEFKPCLIGKADLKEVVKPYLKKWQWPKSVDDFLDYWFQSENIIDQRMVKYIEELKKKGVKCYLLINQEIYRTKYMENKMGFKQLFDRIFSSAEVGLKKPHAEFYDFVIKQLNGITKEEVLFWDDDQENVDGALAFGIKSFVYQDFDQFLQKMYRVIISVNRKG